MTSWSEQLRRLRRRLGVTQDALAAELGVSQALVSRWENGEITPSRENRRRLDALLANPRYVAPFERVRVLVEHNPGIAALFAEAEADLRILAMSEPFRNAHPALQTFEPGNNLAHRLGEECAVRVRRLYELGLFDGGVLSVDALWPIVAQDERVYWLANMVPLQTEARDWAVHASFRQIDSKRFEALEPHFDRGARVRVRAPSSDLSE